jgi:3-deoxy-manno-octulosonate cytidylyltransferase (CMP-KDO synthetase)
MADRKCLLVIPARRHSTRLPDKLLLRAGGKTILQHTFEAACRARLPDQVLIATDDSEIVRAAGQFGAESVMTSAECASGTDRVAEAVKKLVDVEIVVNLQGDEPEIDPQAIDRLIGQLQNNRAASMATLATPIRDQRLVHDPACVKVVFDAAGRALYFSRCPIPYVRDQPSAGGDDLLGPANSPIYFQHIGIYAYRRSLLMRLASLPGSRLEQMEKLEQLRVLEQGETILVEIVDEPSRGIDTPEDFAVFSAQFTPRKLAG